MKKILLFVFLIPVIGFSQFDADLNKEADSLLTNTAHKNNAKYFNRLFKNVISAKWNLGNLTTTGTSGPATIVNDSILNIPQYSGGSGLTTASHGLTAVSTDVQLGGTLPSGYVADLESTTSGGFIANMLNTSTGGRFQVAAGTSWFYQNDGAGYMGLRLDTNNGMVLGDISSGAGTTGIIGVNKPISSSSTIGGFKLIMSAPATASNSLNISTYWDFSNNEIVIYGGNNFDATTSNYSIGSLLTLTPVAASFSSNQNNFNVGVGAMIDMSTDDTITRQLTGLSNGINGRLLLIRNNNTTAVIAFNNEDSGSTASNRIHTSTGATLNLNPGKMLMLTYKTAGGLNRWVDISF